MKKIKEAVMNKFGNLRRIKLKTVILLLALISIGCLILVLSLYAAVPQRINYQGKLLDSVGDPVSNGNRNITFRIYNISGGGTALWSETQNKDYKYQLTSIGNYDPLYIKKEIKNNQFVIGGGYKNLEVSWQITGIRKDAYANKNPIITEQEKGEYLHPDVFGK